MTVKSVVVVAVALASSGCVLAPRGAKTEQAALQHAGRPYERGFDERDLPELPEDPDWRDVLRRASLANGDLEAAYFQWAAAVHRIERAGGYPNTPLSVSFEQMVDGGIRGLDGTTIRIAPDAMENLSFPTKVYQAAKVALDDARAAGKRFTAARLELQRKVLTTWFAYALLAERIRIQEANLLLLKLITDAAVSRIEAGAQHQELLRAEIEQRRAEDELRTLHVELPRTRTMLNAMAARAPDAPLPPPKAMPGPRPLPADDAALLAIAVQNNPELAALAQRVRGRKDAVDLARLQYIPDFNPFLGTTGTASQLVGIGVSIPTLLREVGAMVKEAKADLREARAMYRQTTFDRAAQIVAALYALRNSERQVRLFDDQITPTAERIVENVRAGYSAATGTFNDLIDARRVLLDARMAAAEARAARETTLADLEALVGTDLAAVDASASRPPTAPAAPLDPEGPSHG